MSKDCDQSLLSGVQNRTKGHKVEYKKFCINMPKNFFTVRVPKPRHRLHREVMESPSLVISKATCKLSYTTSRGPFQCLQFCDSVYCPHSHNPSVWFFCRSSQSRSTCTLPSASLWWKSGRLGAPCWWGPTLCPM